MDEENPARESTNARDGIDERQFRFALRISF
jgi:hypothetical protein